MDRLTVNGQGLELKGELLTTKKSRIDNPLHF